MKEILTSLFILLVVISTINITLITIKYYDLISDIEDIIDKDLRLELLQSLRSIPVIFLSKIFYHLDGDFFIDNGSYSRFLLAVSLRDEKDLKINKIDLFHRHPEEDFDFNYLVNPNKEQVTAVMEES